MTGLARFSYEHIGIFSKEVVGGQDLVQPGSYEQSLNMEDLGDCENAAITIVLI